MTLPTVSCICITRHRRHFLRQALSYFRRARKLYPGKTEIIIADGSEEPNPELASCTFYVHIPEPSATRQSSIDKIGYYHNVACEKATGDVIIKWDDDDWHSPYRIDRQARLLATVDEGMAYSSSFWWYHVEKRRACRARSWSAGEGASGSLFAFHRSAWRKAPFPNEGLEDGPFCLAQSRAGTTFLNAQDHELVIYMRHHANGSPLTHYAFTDEDTRQCRMMLAQHGDLDFYDELSEILPFQPWNEPNGPGARMRVLSPLQQLWGRHGR